MDGRSKDIERHAKGIGMRVQGVGQTRLMVYAPATLLLSDISLELGVVWPAIRQRGFGDHPYFLGRSLQLSSFIHFYETVWSEFVGSEANEMPEIPCVRRNVFLETGYATLAPGNTSR